MTLVEHCTACKQTVRETRKNPFTIDPLCERCLTDIEYLTSKAFNTPQAFDLVTLKARGVTS